MPTIQRPDVLAAIYDATRLLIDKRAVPTTVVQAGHTIFRSVPVKYLPKPAPGGHASKSKANDALMPRDNGADGANRFSGPSGSPIIPGASGLYCVLQSQALVNEVMHYSRQAGVHKTMPSGTRFVDAALGDKVVIRIRLMSSILSVDLSPHNPGHVEFLNKLLNSPGVQQKLASTQYASRVSLWNRIVDSDDCSVSRGIGLAVAASGVYTGLVAQTVRKSGRSIEERGDNLILYGQHMRPIPNLYVEEAYYFDPMTQTTESFPVLFP